MHLSSVAPESAPHQIFSTQLDHPCTVQDEAITRTGNASWPQISSCFNHPERYASVSSYTYRNHQGFNLLLVKENDGSLRAHIKDRSSQGTIWIGGKALKEVAVKIEKGIGDPLAFLAAATQRADAYRAHFYQGEQHHDHVVLVGRRAAGLQGGVLHFALLGLGVGLQVGLSIGDLQGRVQYLEKHVNRLAEDMIGLSQAVTALSSSLRQLEATLYTDMMQNIAKESELLLALSQKKLKLLNQQNTAVLHWIDDVLGCTACQVIPALADDASFNEGTAFIRIKYLAQKMSDLERSPQRLALRGPIHQLRDHLVRSIDQVAELISMVNFLLPYLPDQSLNPEIREQVDRNTADWLAIRDRIKRIQVGTPDARLIGVAAAQPLIMGASAPAPQFF